MRSTPSGRAAAVAAAAVIGAAALAGCSSGPRPTSGPGAGATSSPPPDLAVPAAATSVVAGGGSWATVAMGHLGDPVNTFWQLLHSPDGTSRWTDRVAVTAVATNGGIVVATAGSDVAAAVVPSQALRFSPVVVSTDGGQHWATGLIGAGIAPGAGSLALGPGGRAVALTGPASDPQVQVSSGPLAAWRTVATLRSLAATPAGRACGLARIETVSYGAPGIEVGGACRHPGVVGLFRYSPSAGWTADGPRMPASARSGTTEVVSEEVTGPQSSISVVVSGSGGDSVVPAWRSAAGGWSTGAPLPLAGHARLDAVVAGPGSRLWVLSADGPALGLDTTAGPGAAWTRYPDPPAGTATVSPGPGGAVTALAVDAATLTTWTATSPAAGWHRGQVLPVPIEYGSSA